jgi:multidrug efflux pump subunit AcrA (membrane-fusion protein)
VAVVVAFEAWQNAHATTTVRYITAPVTRGAVTRAVTASGSVNPVITIQVGTYVSGVIQQLYCDYNTVVRKGQLCAKIDPRPYQVIVDQDRANVSTAKAQLTKDETSLALAELTYDRTVDLRTRGIVSQDTLDSAKSTYDQALAQVELDKSTIEQRQAALNAAEINLAYTNIVSPGLVREEHGERHGDERQERVRPAFAGQRQAPDTGGAQVRQGLQRQRRNEPPRSKLAEQPCELLEFADVDHDADHRGEQQQPEEPRRMNRPPRRESRDWKFVLFYGALDEMRLFPVSDRFLLLLRHIIQ